MDRLLDELIANGILEGQAAAFARRHQAERGGAVDTALLELDLIDEEGLLRALGRCHGMAVAAPSDLEQLSSELARRLPQGLSRSFFLCPMRVSGNALVALVQRPLSESSKTELHELFGLELKELIAPEHYLLIASHRVYKATLEERHRQLELRLERKRSAPPLEVVIARLGSAASFAAAVEELLDFAMRLVDFACMLVADGGQLRVAAARRAGIVVPPAIPVPAIGSSLAPAIAHGGYFFGPPTGSPADRQFYAALGRALPRCAFVAPVAKARTKSTYLYVDNAERGIAARFIAELTVLVGRLAQKTAERPKERPPPAPVPLDAPSVPLPVAARSVPVPVAARSVPVPVAARSVPVPVATRSVPVPVAAPSVPLAIDPPVVATSAIEPASSRSTPPSALFIVPTTQEQRVLDRLRAAAGDAQMDLEAFVEELLRRAAQAPREPATAVLMDEVKTLFEKLTMDIPAHLARGMQSALRDMASTGTPPNPHVPVPAASSAATPSLVEPAKAHREPANYAARRQKTPRVKL